MRAFTLLEIMLAVVLLMIAASVIGIRTSRALEEKQFHASAQRLLIELESSRHLAINMQADWNVEIEKKNDLIIVSRTSVESQKSIAHQWKTPCVLKWNQETVEKMVFLFSSTGKVVPSGVLEIIKDSKKVVWNIPQIFTFSEGSDGAIPRPDDH